MRFEILAMASLSVIVACGGNVVVNHGSGNGSANGGSGHGGNGSGASPGVGGSTGDVLPVGPSSATGVGGSTNTGMGTGGSIVSVGVTTTGAGTTTCTSGVCSVSSDGSCECKGNCSNGEHVRVSCGTDPGINCSCFKNGQFVGNCQPSGQPNCEPDQSCCKQFF